MLKTPWWHARAISPSIITIFQGGCCSGVLTVDPVIQNRSSISKLLSWAPRLLRTLSVCRAGNFLKDPQKGSRGCRTGPFRRRFVRNKVDGNWDLNVTQLRKEISSTFIFILVEVKAFTYT